MATFGQGINPALGATDYTGYLQGALRGAEMQAQGMSNIGQGLASLGQSVGQAVAKRSEENKVLGAEIKSGLSTLKAVLDNQSLPAEIKQQAKLAMDTLKDNSLSKREQAAVASQFNQQFNAVLAAGLQTTMAIARQQAQAAPIARAFSAGAPISDTSPEGRSAYALSQGADPRMVKDAREAVEPAKRTESKGTPMTLAQINSLKQQGLDVTAVPMPDGTFVATSISPFGAAQKFVRTPDEEAEAAGKSEEAKGVAAQSVKYLTTLADQAEQAQQSQAKYSRLRTLLESPSTQTGAGQEYVTFLRSVASRLGAKDATLSNQQEMEALVSEDALLETRRLLSGQGAVTEGERARVDRVALDARKNKASLLELLSIREGAIARSLAAEDRRIELVEQGVRPRDAEKIMRKWMRDNPLSAFIPAGGPETDEEVIGSAFKIVGKGKK